MTDSCVSNGVNFLRQDVRVINEQISAILEVNDPCCEVDGSTIRGTGTTQNPLELTRIQFTPGGPIGFPRATIIGTNPVVPNQVTNLTLEVPHSGSGYGTNIGFLNTLTNGQSQGSSILGGEDNLLRGNFNAILGGFNNVLTDSTGSFITGTQNSITDSTNSGVLGGTNNAITGVVDNAFALGQTATAQHSNTVVINMDPANPVASSVAHQFLLQLIGGGATTGQLIINGLPTANPGGTNIVWNNGGVLNIT